MSYGNESIEPVACSNCNRQIAIENYPSHQAYCEKYVRDCHTCSRLIDTRSGEYFRHSCFSLDEEATKYITRLFRFSCRVDEMVEKCQTVKCRCCGFLLSSRFDELVEANTSKGEIDYLVQSSEINRTGKLNQSNTLFMDKRPHPYHQLYNYSDEEEDSFLQQGCHKKRKA